VRASGGPSSRRLPLANFHHATRVTDVTTPRRVRLAKKQQLRDPPPRAARRAAPVALAHSLGEDAYREANRSGQVHHPQAAQVRSGLGKIQTSKSSRDPRFFEA